MLLTIASANADYSILPTIGSQGTVTLSYDPSSYSGGNSGGAFLADSPQIGSFYTFCIQDTVEFYAGQQYDYTVGNNVSLGAAYLFSHFSDGNLPGFNYNLGSGFTQSSTELQDAIWYFQGQIPTPADGATYVSWTLDSLHDTTSQALANSGGAYNVGALDMYSGNTPAQDQLTMVSSLPEPSQAVAGGVLIGAGGIVWLIRRRKVLRHANH